MGGRNALFTVIDQKYFRSYNWMSPPRNKQLDVFCSLLHFGTCIWEENESGTNIFEYAKKSENYQMEFGLGTDLHLKLRQLQPLVKFAKNMKKESQICEEGMKKLSWWRILVHLPSQIILLFKHRWSIGRLRAML